MGTKSRPKQTSQTVCYLCGQPGADSTEHVVSRCLWPDRRLPNGVPTLPAHRHCNGATSKDEEAFRNFISLSMPADSPGRALWDRTWRAIQKPKAKGMKRALYENIARSTRRALGHTHGRLVATIEPDRAERVLAKIVRGLFLIDTGEHLPADLWWHFAALRPGGDAGVALPNVRKVGDVLSARWVRVAEAPGLTMWTLWFYGTIGWYCVTKTAADFDAGPQARPSVQYTWR